MKYEEPVSQSRLTPEPPHGYARSMPDQVEFHDAPSDAAPSPNKTVQRNALTPDEVLKEMLAKGDKSVMEQLQKMRDEHTKTAEEGVEEKKESEEKDASPKTDTVTTQKDKTEMIDLTEASPKSSLYGEIIKAVKGTLTDEKLVKRVDTFTKEYESLKNADLNSQLDTYNSWSPPTDKHDPQRVVYMVIQKYIAQLVEDKGEVPLSVFLQAANADRTINVAEVLSESTDGATAGAEKAMQRLMVAMDEKPIEEWSTNDLAEELVQFKTAINADGEATPIDEQIVKTVESFVLDKVEETGVTKEAFDTVVTLVEKEHEDTLIAAAPVFEEEEIKPLAPEKEDAVPEGDPALSHDTVHSFEPLSQSIHNPTLSSGNDPEVALARWREFKHGEEPTPQEKAYASRGYMPAISPNESQLKEETQDFPLPEAARVTSLHRLSDEENESDTVVHFRADEEESQTQERIQPVVMGVDDEEEDDDDDSPTIYPETLDNAESKAKIGDTEITIKGYVKGGADGLLGRAFNNLRRQNPAGAAKIRDEYEVKKREVLAALDAGDIAGAKRMSEELTDNLTAMNKQIDEELNQRRAETGRRGGGSDVVERVGNILVEKKNGYFNPTSMNELAALIGDDEPDYAPGGDHAMLDDEGNFIEENFMYWVQDKFIYFDDQDPDNPQRFFDLIKIENGGMLRELSVNALLANKGKFFKAKEYVTDPRTGEVTAVINSKTNKAKTESLQELYNYLTDFVWLVGTIRNVNAEYIQQMSDDNKIGELIASVMKSNVLTKRSAGKENTLEAVATLSSKFRDWGNVSRLVKELERPDGTRYNKNDIVLSLSERNKIKRNNPERAEIVESTTAAFKADVEKLKKTESNIDVGDGVAVGYLIYYNIADYDYLNRKFSDTNFFTKKGMEAVIRDIAKLSQSEMNEPAGKAKLADFLARAALIDPIQGKQPAEIESAYQKWIDSWYYTENDVKEENKKSANKRNKGVIAGNLKEEAKSKFISMMNVFDSQKNANQNDMAKRFIQLVVADRLDQHKPKTEDVRKADLDINNKLDRLMSDSSAAFAQRLSSFMTFFTGAAARNDIGVNAVNAASKMRWIDFYKQKQGENTRAGGFGNLYNLGTVRSSYSDMMVGMVTVSGKTIMEVFEEKERALKNNATFEERSDISRQLLFNLNDAKQYGSAGPSNSIKIFHQEIEGKEVDFHKFIHVNPLNGHISYKPDAMLDAIQDAIIKPTRYAWSTNRVPFHKIVRTMIDNKSVPPKYRTVTQLEDMFTPKVLKVIEETYRTSNKGNPKVPQDLLKDGFLTKDGRVRRYAVNNEGKFIDKNGKVIDTNEKTRNEWKHKLVLDLSEDGQMDPVMAKYWNDTSFRRCVVKGYLVNRFAGQLFGHTSTHSPYEYMDYGLREDVIRGLMQIPTDPQDHDGEFENKHIGGHYFTKDDIKMLRNLSKNQLWRNIPLALGADLRVGLLDALKAYFSRIMKESTAGI